MSAGWRNAIAAIGLVLALAAVVGGPAAVDSALPALRPVPVDDLYVGFGVSLRPPPGSQHDAGSSRPGSGTVELRTGGLTVRVTSAYVRERPADYLRHARRKLDRDDGLRVQDTEPARTAAGVPGERGAVRPTDADGEAGCYAAFTAELAGVTVLITPVTDCAAVPAPVWAVVSSLTFDREPAW